MREETAVTRRDALRTGVAAASALTAGCVDAVRRGKTAPAVGTAAGPGETSTPPATGERVPELSIFDDVMIEHMDDHGIGAGVLALRRNGETVLERGYGWADRNRTTPVEPDAVFRIGSVSKLFTQALTLRLIESGALRLDQRVYPLVGIDPPSGALADERVREITVEHLLSHTAGWDRDHHEDPLYHPTVVSDALSLDGPPTRTDILQYVLDRPLQFSPGQRRVYSNLGYVLLAAVIEATTGRSYQTHLRETLFAPRGIDGIELGRTRPADRHPDEIWYERDEQCRSAFEPWPVEAYPCPAHGFLVETFQGAGGQVARARSLARAIDRLEWTWVGENVRTSPDRVWFFGTHPGSFAYAERWQETTVVALFNGRTDWRRQAKELSERVRDIVANRWDRTDRS